MAMKSSAKRTVYYSYPPELVWKALGFGNQREVDPLTEEEFESREPAPNTVFTKALEVKQNEVFAFRMKARGFYATMRVELTPTAPCETKMTVREDVEYRLTSSYIASRFGLSIRQELSHFTAEINKRLADMNEMKSK